MVCESGEFFCYAGYIEDIDFAIIVYVAELAGAPVGTVRVFTEHIYDIR